MNDLMTPLTKMGGVRLILPALLVVLATTGCGRSTGASSQPLVPPSHFVDSAGEWEQDSDGPSSRDNQSIAAFFDGNPDLLGSPEWMGTPQKYVCSASSSLTRFYWFGGNSNQPSWNALEVDGTRVRDLYGKGFPGE